MEGTGATFVVLKVSWAGETFRLRAPWPLELAKAKGAVAAALAHSAEQPPAELRLWHCDDAGAFHELLPEAASADGALSFLACAAPPSRPLRLHARLPEGAIVAAKAHPGAAPDAAPAATATPAAAAPAAVPATATAAAQPSLGAKAWSWLETNTALVASSELNAAVEASRAEARARLAGTLQLYGAKLKETVADGNCQFRALSLQLYGEQAHHAALRARVVEQLARRRERYEHYVQGSFEGYLMRMGKDGEWGDNVTLQAASDMLGCDVQVLTDQPGAAGLVEVKPLEPTAGGQSALWLAFITELHYDAVEFPQQ